jgi:hypothetical protein
MYNISGEAANVAGRVRIVRVCLGEVSSCMASVAGNVPYRERYAEEDSSS